MLSFNDAKHIGGFGFLLLLGFLSRTEYDLQKIAEPNLIFWTFKIWLGKMFNYNVCKITFIYIWEVVILNENIA